MWAGRKYLLTKATMVHGGTDQGEPEAGERLAKRKQITQAMAAKRMVAAMGCPLQLRPQDAHPPVLSAQRLKSILSHRFASDYQGLHAALRGQAMSNTRCAIRQRMYQGTVHIEQRLDGSPATGRGRCR